MKTLLLLCYAQSVLYFAYCNVVDEYWLIIPSFLLCGWINYCFTCVKYICKLFSTAVAGSLLGLRQTTNKIR